MVVELPESKRQRIKELVSKFKPNRRYKIRHFAEMLGFLVSCCPAVNYGLAHTKACETVKFHALNSSNQNYEANLILDKNTLDELHWWRVIGSTSLSIIRNYSYELEIFSDASLSGWGAACGNRKCHGFWSESEKGNSINFLELMAAFFGLNCFAKNHRKCQILLRIDNTTAIAYINRMGGVQYKDLSQLAKEIWKWCEERDIWIFASYIGSKDNIVADSESRTLKPNTEFELSKEGFDKIVDNFGLPEIDLFASRSNAKCTKYIAWMLDPFAVAVDAFTVSWNHEFFYAFPPFSIILKTLQKIKQEGSRGIVIVPNWPSQPWYPIFQSLLISETILLEANSYVISPFSDRQSQRFWENLILAAGVLSGEASS